MTLLAATVRRAARSALFRTFDADRVLPRAARRGHRRLAFAWVRGVGDVAFILSEFTRHVQRVVPGAHVTALVRPGLAEACRWIPELHEVVTVEEWSRERTQASLWDLAFPPAWEIRRARAPRGRAADIDAIVPYPLGRWYERGRLARRPWLRWTEAEQQFGVNYLRRLVPDEGAFVIAMNTRTGTARYYDHVKDWGDDRFDALLGLLLERLPHARVVLVDGSREAHVRGDDRIVDARGQLSISQCVSVIAASHAFVGLDTGPANLVYFLRDVTAELIVLLGRRSVFTPLEHPPASPGVTLHPLFGEAEDVHRITPDAVLQAVLAVERRARAGLVR